MNVKFRNAALALLTSVALLTIASTTHAGPPQALLLPPQNDCYVPKFGFSSFNIHGVGERVTHVRWGGLAARLGLEPGDMILSLNGYRLIYHGAWNDALHEAMHEGGLVRLRIRDVRTGHVAFREIYVGDEYGPITPKSHVVDYPQDYPDDHCAGPGYGGGYPHGPITLKSKVGSALGGKFNQKFDGKFDKKLDKDFNGPKDFNKQFKKVAKLFDDKD